MNAEIELSVTADQPKSLINWFAVGEQCVLLVGEIRVVIRLVGRKGRRARIAVSAIKMPEAGRLIEPLIQQRK